MFTGVYILFVAAKAATLLCGGALTVLSARAARRTGSRALRALAVGIGLVTAGTLAGGLIHQFVGLPLNVGVAVSSAFTALGLGVMTYSLYAETSGRDADHPGGPGRASGTGEPPDRARADD